MLLDYFMALQSHKDRCKWKPCCVKFGQINIKPVMSNTNSHNNNNTQNVVQITLVYN